MTIPNILTLIRIALTPLMVWSLSASQLQLALVIFFLAGITDGLDGLIARVFHQKSRLGAYMDPLADKLLLVSSFVMLAHLNLVPSWLAVIAVGRDFMIVSGLTVLMLYRIPVEIKPALVSKLTTLLQLFTVLMAMSSSFLDLARWFYMLLFGTTAVLSLVSGVQYVLIGISLFDLRGCRNGGRQGG